MKHHFKLGLVVSCCSAPWVMSHSSEWKRISQWMLRFLSNDQIFFPWELHVLQSHRVTQTATQLTLRKMKFTGTLDAWNTSSCFSALYQLDCSLVITELWYHTVTITQGRAIQLTSTGVEALQGSQTLTVASSPTPQPGATILQCAPQPGDSPQQFYIQGGQVLIQGRVQLILVKLNVRVSRKCGMGWQKKKLISRSS